MLPDPPEISADEMRECRETGDYSPVVFQWYKFVAGVCFTFAALLQETPIVRKDVSKRDYGILIGLLNRCARIMLANVALSHEGRFGESTAILDRSIFESCVILAWLCKSTQEDRFDRYVASGLRTQIELRNELQKAITARRGSTFKIENRMLQSVDACLTEAGFDEAKLDSTGRLPALASMLEYLGRPRFWYTAGQRTSSDHVHGTWVGLRQHYIEQSDDGSYHSKPFSATHVDQYIYITYAVLDALGYFANFVFVTDEKQAVLTLFEGTANAIAEIHKEIVGSDYDLFTD